MKPNFKKSEDGLIPVIIQDYETNVVLMLGYMNEEAFLKTQLEKRVTFFSRSKNRLWTKGEESGNYLLLKDMQVDCDNDTLLIKVIPQGPTCHTGADTCWNEVNASDNFLKELDQIIADRKKEQTGFSEDSFMKQFNELKSIKEKVEGILK